MLIYTERQPATNTHTMAITGICRKENTCTHIHSRAHRKPQKTEMVRG